MYKQRKGGNVYLFTCNSRQIYTITKINAVRKYITDNPCIVYYSIPCLKPYEGNVTWLTSFCKLIFVRLVQHTLRHPRKGSLCTCMQTF